MQRAPKAFEKEPSKTNLALIGSSGISIELLPRIRKGKEEVEDWEKQRFKPGTD